MKTISIELLTFYGIVEEGLLFLLDMGYKIMGVWLNQSHHVGDHKIIGVDHPLLYTMVCAGYADYLDGGYVANYKTKNWMRDKQFRLQEFPNSKGKEPK